MNDPTARRRLTAPEVVGALRDVLIVGIGALTLYDTPPSLRELGATWASALWSLMLITGSAMALAGLVRQRPGWEVIGACTTGGGFVVWAVAAFRQPDLDAVGVAIGLLFLGAALGQVQKALAANTGALATAALSRGA